MEDVLLVSVGDDGQGVVIHVLADSDSHLVRAGDVAGYFGTEQPRIEMKIFA